MRRERQTLPRDKDYGPLVVTWIKSDWFCMECGKQDVWQEVDGGDDYYHAMEAVCFSCRHRMCCLSEVKD